MTGNSNSCKSKNKALEKFGGITIFDTDVQQAMIELVHTILFSALIIVSQTAIIGFSFFKENLSRTNWAGIIIAIIAIMIISAG